MQDLVVVFSGLHREVGLFPNVIPTKQIPQSLSVCPIFLEFSSNFLQLFIQFVFIKEYDKMRAKIIE